MYSRLGVYHLARQARQATPAATPPGADRRDPRSAAYPNELAMFFRLGLVVAGAMTLAALIVWATA
ncbi:hypothetical protein RB623_06045 [Mesorhizobium sp. LHD-90]|uniref:hypothetical protein n=1 Tax=Mesorhizobium sp. LHD-90 TaxID=3071414 RepID=UPI0027E04814|nr:hypothetical protein [Mesorhizobium sp. LHD-90]MDQ6433611.1 hypothetical protein [Mesorhizobium sp. LHD-90]